MPREIVHWSILEEVKSRIQREGNNSIVRILNENRAISYLGAMAPDAPYFYRMGGSSFEHVAEAMHGTNGEDTFALAREFARKASTQSDQRIKESLFAFLAGFLSHCAVDIVFHPVIYHLTGDYYDTDPLKQNIARKRHRLFEVMLDSWWKNRSNNLFTAKIVSVLNFDSNTEQTLFDILNDLNGFSGPWEGAFRHLAYLQAMFTSNFGGIFAKGLNFLSGNKLDASEVLFLYGRDLPHSYFDSMIEYKSPVSGESHRKSAQELCDEACMLCISIIKPIGELIENKISIKELESTWQHGRSLNSGEARSAKKDMKYFAAGLLPWER